LGADDEHHQDTLVRAVAVAFRKARDLHGSPRLHADLRAAGWAVSEKTVADSMRRQGLVGAADQAPERPEQAGQDRTEVPGPVATGLAANATAPRTRAMTRETPAPSRRSFPSASIE